MATGASGCATPLPAEEWVAGVIVVIVIVMFLHTCTAAVFA